MRFACSAFLCWVFCSTEACNVPGQEMPFKWTFFFFFTGINLFIYAKTAPSLSDPKVTLARLILKPILISADKLPPCNYFHCMPTFTLNILTSKRSPLYPSWRRRHPICNVYTFLLIIIILKKPQCCLDGRQFILDMATVWRFPHYFYFKVYSSGQLKRNVRITFSTVL